MESNGTEVLDICEALDYLSIRSCKTHLWFYSLICETLFSHRIYANYKITDLNVVHSRITTSRPRITIHCHCCIVKQDPEM